MTSRATRVFGSQWFWWAFVAAGFAVWTGGFLRLDPPDLPPDLGALAEIVADGPDGQPVRSGALAGRVWVAARLDDRCADDCPARVAMRDLQKRFRRIKDKLQLVSVCDAADCRAETAQAVAEYYGEKPGVWSVWQTKDGSALRSGELTVVDRAGRVRGRYPFEKAGRAEVVRDVTRLFSLAPRRAPPVEPQS